MSEDVTSSVVTSSFDTTTEPGETLIFQNVETENISPIVTTPDVLERIYANTKQSADCLTSIVGVGAVCFIILIASGLYKFFKRIT